MGQVYYLLVTPLTMRANINKDRTDDTLCMLNQLINSVKQADFDYIDFLNNEHTKLLYIDSHR